MWTKIAFTTAYFASPVPTADVDVNWLIYMMFYYATGWSAAGIIGNKTK